MKYSANLYKYENKEKDSKKRIHYISNRIKRLENDINKIRSKEKDNTSLFSLNNQDIYNNPIKTIEQYKSKKTNEDSFNIQNNLLNNSVNVNNIFNKFSTNKLITSKTKYNDNNNNNYNSIIHEKKKLFLNINNSNKKTIDSNIKDDYINNIKIKNKSSSKIKNFFSFNESYVNHTEKRNDKGKRIIKYNFNNIEKLNYKFEIRNLQKKLNSLLKENNNIKTKLSEFKIINKDLENNIFNNGNEANLLNDIIMLNRQYTIINNRNESEIEYDLNNNNNIIINNNSLSDNDNYNNSIENILLNIMDMKFNYDNNLLKDEFINGVNELFNISLLTDENSFDYDYNNIVESINKTIDKKNNLNNTINKYKYLSKENNKYKNYCTYLINDLNLKSITELDEFIKNLYLKNIKENHHMKKLQIALMNESSSSKPKKVRKKINFSSNMLLNCLNQSIDNNNNSVNINKSYCSNNILMNEKSINQNKISNKNIENRNNSIKNNGIIYKKNKNGLLFSGNKQNYNYGKSKIRKININFFNQRNNNYGIRNVFNNNISKNVFNTKEDTEDIKYFNNIGKNKIGKQLTSKDNDFDRNYYGHIKNHSVIIFNK